MQNDIKPYDPIAYSWWVLTVGVVLALAVISWVVIVLFITRKKKPKTVAHIKPLEPVLPNIPALQQKYLALIKEVQDAYGRKEISARVLHQKLSILLRFFVFECRGIRAPVLTLADLKMTSLKKLSDVVEDFYAPEFQAVSNGSVDSAIAKATEMVTSWS